MNSMIRTTLFGLLAMAHVTHAASPRDGFYAGALFGGTYEHNLNFSSTSPIGTLSLPVTLPVTASENKTATLGFKLLVNAGGQFGYRFCENYRVEIEALYNNNPYSFLRIGDTTIHAPDTSTGLRIKGSTTEGIGFFNAYYDFLGLSDGDSSVVPYVGLGIGYAYIYNVARLYYNNEELNPTGKSLKKTVTTPAGQVMLGMSYFMDDFMSVGMDIRYYATSPHVITNRFNRSFNTQLEVYSANIFFNGALELG